MPARKNPGTARRHYCTVCGEDLEDFCFTPEAEDVESLRTKALVCKVKGHMTGDVCAKVFIAGADQRAELGRPSRAKKTRETVEALKHSIRRLIRSRAR